MPRHPPYLWGMSEVASLVMGEGESCEKFSTDFEHGHWPDGRVIVGRSQPRTARDLRYWAIVLALLLLGAALRLGAMGEAPPGLYHDEAYHGLDALAILEGGTLPLYFPANNGREPLYIYLVTASVALLGRTPVAVRLPSFFIGMLTLAATYDLARVLWGRRAGRWALAVLSATFWHVHLGRVGFRAVLLPLFTALYLAQLARGCRTNRRTPWLWAGILYGLSWYAYIAARFTPVALAGMALYVVLTGRISKERIRRGGWRFCLAALIVLLPLGIYTLRHPDVVLQRTGQVSVFDEEINEGDLWGALARHTLRTAGMFVVRGDRIWRHNLAYRPVWGPALGLMWLIGVGVALARCRRDLGAALVLIWTATMALPTLLAEDAPHFLRAVGVLPTAALFPVLGLLWLETRLQELAQHPLVRRLPWALVGLAFVLTTYDYFVTYAEAPLAYHWFEGGPVELAGEINALRNVGWDGERMLHGPPADRTITLDRQLWESWTAAPFLVPQSTIRFLPVDALPTSESVAFVVWPYRDWEADVWPHLPHPAYLRVFDGPQAQGDNDPAPFTIAAIIRADPRPEAPAPVARFAEGVILRAALVQQEDDGIRVQLYWDAAAPSDADYTVFVHYLRDGAKIAQHDRPPADGHLPTTLWQPGDLVLDVHPLAEITPDPARDQLRVGLYRADTGDGLPVLDASGAPASDWVTLGVILTSE